MISQYREHARAVIAKVLSETAGKSEKEVRRALRNAYPFGVRAYWQYRVWCEEVRAMLAVRDRLAELDRLYGNKPTEKTAC